MHKLLAAAATVLLLSAASATPGFAFRGCGPAHAAACHGRVVLLQPGYREVIPQPALYVNRVTPVQVSPGRWRTSVVAPVYGARVDRVRVSPPADARFRRPLYADVVRPVLLRPGRVSRVYQPPMIAYYNRPTIVQPATVSVLWRPPVYAVAHERMWRPRYWRLARTSSY